MLKKRVPPRLWDYGFAWVCETDNICANLSRYADGWTPLEIITGETPDISEYLDFDFYDCCYTEASMQDWVRSKLPGGLECLTVLEG